MTAIRTPFPLREIVSGLVGTLTTEDWTITDGEFWCHVSPPAGTTRVQGWKLHLSATPLTAPLVLHAAAEVLLAHGVAFKFARDMRKVGELSGIRYDRAQAGKFIAVYPADDEQFHTVAAALADAVAGYSGPRILSDRPYRPNSIVQYRFGAFTGVRTLTNDGSYEARLRTPDGATVTDRRTPWFAPPEWATPLVLPSATGLSAGLPAAAAPAPAAPAATAGKNTRPRLDNGRFEVHEAIRQSARGGVYRAVDTSTGNRVIVKQARAHIGTLRDGTDARQLLAHEHEVLAHLSPLTPRPVHVFSRDDHVFLVEEQIEGRSLAEHASQDAGRPPTDVAALTATALGVVRLLRAVHERGWVYRDLSTGNVMVTPDGTLRLIDPEYAARPGDLVTKIYTPGFAAPEVLDAPNTGPAPGPAADVYAVGAVLIQLALGVPPMLLADSDPQARPVHERIAALLDLAGDRPVVRRWRELLLGLTRHEPDKRWTLAQAEDFLLAVDTTAPDTTPPDTSAPDTTVPAPAPGGTTVPQARSDDAGDGRGVDPADADLADRVLADGLRYLLDTMSPERAWLWPVDGFGGGTDPLNVQYGAAGVLSTLRRAALDGPDDLLDRVNTALPVVAEWIAARLERSPRVLPGLYFGRAGTCWELRETAELLGRTDLAETAERHALELPHHWPNPDVCHGAAGAGLALVRLWQLTGRQVFLDRIEQCADGLLDAAVEYDDGVWWPIPGDFESSLAGMHHLGFGHGVAGVGTFLLAAAAATGASGYLDRALDAGRTLAAAAEVDVRAGTASWRSDRVAKPRGDMRFHWCSGSSGVGTFLVRLADASPPPAGGPQYDTLITQAARAVHLARWVSPTAACHGLAGNAQFLLDVADRGDGDRTARRWAQDLTDVLIARHAVRDGRTVLPDESGQAVTAGYQTGLAGPLDLLMRLRSGGGRRWMVDGS